MGKKRVVAKYVYRTEGVARDRDGLRNEGLASMVNGTVLVIVKKRKKRNKKNMKILLQFRSGLSRVCF